MKVRCTAGGCGCEKSVDVEVFQTGTGQVVEHAHPIACAQCQHRWDLHSGIPEPRRREEREAEQQQPAA